MMKPLIKPEIPEPPTNPYMEKKWIRRLHALFTGRHIDQEEKDYIINLILKPASQAKTKRRWYRI